MISLYFGLPGCGKTTLLSKFALDACRKGRKVYGNIPLAIQGYTRIDNNCVGHYDLSDSLLLIDEGTLFAIFYLFLFYCCCSSSAVAVLMVQSVPPAVVVVLNLL